MSLEDDSVLEQFKVPERTVETVGPAAFRCGAVLIDRWYSKWGTAVAFSFPGTECAWFLVDDFEHGKFAAIGVRVIEEISFGFPTAFYWGDEDQAARYALSYGFRKDNQQAIEEALSRNEQFPYKEQRLRRLFGPLDALEDMTVVEGLRYLQFAKGVDPMTVIAATRTIEVVNE